MSEQSKDREALATYSRDPEETVVIAKLVGLCFLSQKRYSQRIEDLPTIIDAFNHVLKKYKIVDIKNAFDVYLDTANETPTPADIVRIIDPPKEWCLQKFLAIKKKKEAGNIFVVPKDEEYYKGYLKRDLKGW